MSYEKQFLQDPIFVNLTRCKRSFSSLTLYFALCGLCKRVGMHIARKICCRICDTANFSERMKNEYGIFEITVVGATPSKCHNSEF